ncbi:hypothetical protein [Psychroflexus sp. ALD_RP9]|uniref:hypothetical protein n=1 Tax=Psychroflexus sp. ALD_RP9 TaxID=2777186 RepID=UPI001A8CE788|nr:hypothetical protein [Psychroflexus sp. ALD_RP9]QSS96610.1 hypothetical protein IMZ30_09170 [Psychroflexus sp. ALD_RP9]
MKTLTQTSAKQRRLIHQLCHYDADLKQELVYQFTKGRTTTSLELKQDEAQALISSLQINWATFNKNNQQHRYILSLLRQIGWTKQHSRHGQVADLERLSNFLKSAKSPVKKPLQSMSVQELNTIINCLESMLGKKMGAK